MTEREREALMRLTMCAREECGMCKYKDTCGFDFQYELATKNMNILAEALRKTENSSEKPNNYCDDCLYTDTCDSKEFFYACTSKATISKMEQADKPQNNDLLAEIALNGWCKTCKHLLDEDCDCDIVFTGYEPKDEPQTDCYVSDLCKHYGDKQICGRCRSRNLFCEAEPQPRCPKCGKRGYIRSLESMGVKLKVFDEYKWKCTNCNKYFKEEPKDEPQTYCDTCGLNKKCGVAFTEEARHCQNESRRLKDEPQTERGE